MADSYLGESIKKLGFGLMRLPMNGDEIDMDQTKKMVDTFMSKGFTYFDTAYVYIGGKSEVALKEAWWTAIPGTASSAPPSCLCGTRRPTRSSRKSWTPPCSGPAWNTTTSTCSTP